MFEQGSETGEPLIEIAIDTDSAEENAAAAELLATLDLEHLVRQTLQTVRIEQAVTLTLVMSGDSTIQALNLQYRRLDKPTDVLSFPLLDEPLVQAPTQYLWQKPEAEETDGEGEAPATPAFVTPAELATNLGDIIISWPTARRQADEAGHTMADELLFLLCHGVLHLVGYDDQTEAGYVEMVRLQKAILAASRQEG